MNTRTLSILTFLVFTTVLNSETFGQQLTDLEWLAGDWITENNGSQVTESWSYMNDSTLVGSSVTMKNDSITFEEALRIELRNDSIRYVAVLPFKIAVFGLTERSKDNYIFEDRKNDFPSLIRYRKTKKGLQVILEGKGNKQEMNFVRKK